MSHSAISESSRGKISKDGAMAFGEVLPSVISYPDIMVEQSEQDQAVQWWKCGSAVLDLRQGCR